MFKGKTVYVMLCTLLMILATGVAGELKDDWNDFLHYTKIGRFDLAKRYGQALLDADPNAVDLFNLTLENPQGFQILTMAQAAKPDPELAAVTDKVLAILFPLFFILGLGYVLARIRFLEAGVVQGLNKLVYWVALPSIIIFLPTIRLSVFCIRAFPSRIIFSPCISIALPFAMTGFFIRSCFSNIAVIICSALIIVSAPAFIFISPVKSPFMPSEL